MFAEMDVTFVRAIVRLLKPQVLLEGDFAFRKNEPGDTMYFIQMGRIQIGNVDFSVVFAVKRARSYFGEFAMFTAQRRSASARALQAATGSTADADARLHVATVPRASLACRRTAHRRP